MKCSASVRSCRCVHAAQAGLDSLGAVDLRNALSARFATDALPATLAFDYPTTAALAGLIASLQLAAAEGAASGGRPSGGSPAAGLLLARHGSDSGGCEALAAACIYPSTNRGGCQGVSVCPVADTLYRLFCGLPSLQLPTAATLGHQQNAFPWDVSGVCTWN